VIRLRTRRFWTDAQAQERDAWARMGFAAPGYLARRGAMLDAWVRLHREPRGRVLEIGGAGLPAVEYLDGFAERVALDPLMEEYARLFGDAACPDGVTRLPGRAEALPFPDAHFEAVLLLNVLDHVQDPARVLGEVRRVLAPGGTLFFSCDTYAASWLALRRARLLLRGRRRNDILHPHHFTPARLLRLLQRGFETVEVRHCAGDPLAGEERVRTPWPRGGLRNRLKRELRLYVAAQRRA